MPWVRPAKESDMSQLGERLREAREAQGISIAQAAAETRILQRYLAALENGDYQHLPGDIYARGFVRNYASYLGLPQDEMVEIYRRERGTSEPIRVMPVTSAPRIRGVFIPSFFGVFFVVLTLIGLTYLLLSATNRIGDSALMPLPTATAPAVPQSIPTAAAPTSAPVLAEAPTAPAATPQAAGGLVSAEPTATAQAAPIVGEVRIAPGDNPGSWVNIIQDGRSVYQGTLKPGTRREFKAQRTLRINIGNAAVVTIVVNGQEFTGLGGPGEVFTFTWPR